MRRIGITMLHKIQELKTILARVIGTADRAANVFQAPPRGGAYVLEKQLLECGLWDVAFWDG